MALDSPNKFSHMTIALHWVVGLTMIGLLAVGVVMVETRSFWMYGWHKSIGVLIFFIVLVRVFWRLKNGWPTPAGQYQAWEHSLSHVVHWVLIIGTVLMPISGFMHSAAGGYGVSVAGLELVAANRDAEDKLVAYYPTIDQLGAFIHHWLGYLMIAAVILHIVGAFKHHIIDKDGTLRRMMGKSI